MRCPSACRPLAIGALLLLSPLASAMTGTGVSYTAPTGTSDPGWAKVGQVNGGSCVYLGSYASGYWVLSAAHLIASDVNATANINGTDYAVVAGSGVQLINTGNSSYPTADLYLFRVSGDAALAALGNLTLATGAPSTTGPSSAMTTIGWGGGTKGYGTVSVAQSGLAPGTVTVSGSNGNSLLFVAESTTVQLISGDSGGAMFAKVGGKWQLYGINEATGVNGANYVAIASQISGYTTQINGYLTAIPEPGAWAALSVGAALTLASVRRRKNKAPLA